MEIQPQWITEIIKGFFSLIPLFKDPAIKQDRNKIEAKIAEHLTEVSRWSEKVQFFGMSFGEPLDSSTIALTIDTVPRKFKGTKASSETISEESLLSKNENFVLLGDPGSGKTTTIMRLARSLLMASPKSTDDQWQYPIIIRLRDIENDTPISAVIADSLGISYDIVKTEKEITVFQFDKKAGREVAQIKTIAVYKRQVGSLDLDIFISKFLDRTKALVFLDGLDETPSEFREAIEESIESLSLKLEQSRIILSCRSGDFTRHIQSFNTIEICPLNENQIKKITSKWLIDNEDFLERLKLLPFQDLTTRPLFLCQLIVFYRNTGNLPEQPASVYRKIIRLSLEDWDNQRRVKRRSKYANFDPEQKIEFLSALSYRLTYQIKVKRFSHDQLQRAYRSICKSFSLPLNQMTQVAREIESHTGLVLESGQDHFEFSHLSLQEYLCAYYLVREPFAKHLNKYLQEYPPPIAVSVALSANPSNWFAALILRKSELFVLNYGSISSLLSRLILERPIFTSSVYLGIAILQLIFYFNDTLNSYLAELLTNTEVRNALKKAFRIYSISISKSQSASDRILFSLNKEIDNDFDLSIPRRGSIEPDLFDWLLKSSRTKVKADEKRGYSILTIK